MNALDSLKLAATVIWVTPLLSLAVGGAMVGWLVLRRAARKDQSPADPMADTH